jgi:hypothetical protein
LAVVCVCDLIWIGLRQFDIGIRATFPVPIVWWGETKEEMQNKRKIGNQYCIDFYLKMSTLVFKEITT